MAESKGKAGKRAVAKKYKEAGKCILCGSPVGVIVAASKEKDLGQPTVVTTCTCCRIEYHDKLT